MHPIGLLVKEGGVIIIVIVIVLVHVLVYLALLEKRRLLLMLVIRQFKLVNLSLELLESGVFDSDSRLQDIELELLFLICQPFLRKILLLNVRETANNNKLFTIFKF